MSTRATYHFKAGEYRQASTFYIHHDGYPAGAAHYIALMLSCDNDRGGWPCKFLRANDGAEITASHEAHVDTEYRYTFDEKAQTVTIQAREWDGSGQGFETVKWPAGHTIDVLEFIKKNNDAAWQTPTDFVKMNGRYVPKAKALSWVADRLGYAQAAYFQGWIGNASGSLSEVTKHDELLTPNQRNICKALDEALKARFAA